VWKSRCPRCEPGFAIRENLEHWVALSAQNRAARGTHWMTMTELRTRVRRRLPCFRSRGRLARSQRRRGVLQRGRGRDSEALFGFAAINASLRLFHPRSHANELGADGFRVFDSRGRKVHDVRWADVEHLTVLSGNGLTGPGTVLQVAWRCSPRCPGEGRQPWVRGGTNVVGVSDDGALADPYLGMSRCWS
jgi:hypothetical protein